MSVLSDAWRKIKNMIVILHVRHGWMCPNCKNVYSPKIEKCPKCSKKPKIKFKVDTGITTFNHNNDLINNRKYFT